MVILIKILLNCLALELSAQIHCCGFWCNKTLRRRPLLRSSQNGDPICLQSELEHRVKPTLPRCQQRITIYLWILFLRNVMPRTPPPGQGKKWSQRKITASKI